MMMGRVGATVLRTQIKETMSVMIGANEEIASFSTHHEESSPARFVFARSPALSRFVLSSRALLRCPAVEPRPVPTTANNFARWVVQGGTLEGQTTPLWDLGINGSGQVVGVADTGVDDESCFFYDEVERR
jgi:subtilisin family serine protease